MKTFSKTAFILFAALAIAACRKESVNHTATASDEVPLLPENTIDYPQSANDDIATLGRVLFYDKQLSKNNNIACGSCHQQSAAFCDNKRFSPGTHDFVTRRNTPSIFARNGRLFWDGRSSSLQDLVLRPVKDKIEMDIENVDAVAARLNKLDYYTHLFRKAFPSSPRLDSIHMQTAISEFLRNFTFSNNKFSRSRRGEEMLNSSEELGKNLFFGKALCSQCHHVTNDGFGGNNGYGNTNETHNIGLDAVASDAGVGAITGNKSEDGAFLMPVLLNIEFTSPYMHDGRFNTLEEVVEHYNSGIKDHPNLSLKLRTYNSPGMPPVKLNLTDTEKKGLVDFLKTLSDPAILTDNRYSNPFVSRSR